MKAAEEMTKTELLREVKKLQLMALQAKKLADSSMRKKLEDFFEWLTAQSDDPMVEDFDDLFRKWEAGDNYCQHCGRTCDCED